MADTQPLEYSVDKLKLPSNVTEDQLANFPPFKTWLATLCTTLSAQDSPSHPFHANPYRLKSITIESATFFHGPRLGFLKLSADIRTSTDETLPGSVFLRGGSVAMLLLVTDRDTGDEYVVLTSQPRIPAGSLRFTEIPAGMIDDDGRFVGAAAREIREETGLEVREDELINMTKLALDSRDEADADDGLVEESHLQKAVYPSPGGSDEFIPIFLARKEMSGEEVRGLKGRLAGLRDRGEKITLRICRLGELWKVGARDGKTLAAVALYEGLRREGKV